MYYGLKLLMFENKISIEDIAKVLHTHRNTISNKLSGRGDFKVMELLTIKETFFPDVSLEDLTRSKPP